MINFLLTPARALRLTAPLAVLVSPRPSGRGVGLVPIPGVTYTGTVQEGTSEGSITFTISSDGTIVSSYSILGLSGTYTSGGSCGFVAGGDAGIWEGAPIVNNDFSYEPGIGASFQGSFIGPQTASGTLRLFQPSTLPEGVAACDSGTITWTATTTSRRRVVAVAARVRVAAVVAPVRTGRPVGPMQP